MIQLTRLNNSRFAVNCDLIKFVEQAPDTVLTLINGEKLVVRESTEQVIERVLAFRRAIFQPRDLCACASPILLPASAPEPSPSLKPAEPNCG